MAEELERIYIIPLRKNGYNQSKAAPTAIKRVKHFLTRHMKVEEEKIWIDDSLNKAIWAQGKFKMPNKIRVKAVKFDDGVVEAYLPELEFKKSRRELLKEEKEKKEEKKKPKKKTAVKKTEKKESKTKTKSKADSSEEKAGAEETKKKE